MNIVQDKAQLEIFSQENRDNEKPVSHGKRCYMSILVTFVFYRCQQLFSRSGLSSQLWACSSNRKQHTEPMCDLHACYRRRLHNQMTCVRLWKVGGLFHRLRRSVVLIYLETGSDQLDITVFSIYITHFSVRFKKFFSMFLELSLFFFNSHIKHDKHVCEYLVIFFSMCIFHCCLGEL